MNNAIAAFGSTAALNMARNFRGWGGQPINAAQRNRISTRGMFRQRGSRTRVKMIRQRTKRGILGGTNAMQRPVYRKSRMPSRKKKLWKRFSKKVQYLKDKDLGLQTVLINDQITQLGSGTAGNQQSTLSLALYPFRNTSSGWLNDMNAISGLDNFSNPTQLQGTTVNQNTKVMFHTAIMDLTIRNVSAVIKELPLVTEVAAEAAIELDVYEIYAREEFDDQSATYASLSAVLNAYDAPEIGGSGSGIAISDRGATPFEMSGPISRFGLKILSKTKYFIPGGQTITHQIRDPKRKVTTYGDMTSETGYNKRGWTRHLFLLYKLVPGLNIGSAVGDYRCNLVVGSTRKYGFKIEGRNEPRERFFGASYLPGQNN